MLTLLQMKGIANDPGVGWHFKTGEIIATTGQIPRVDPFLFSETPRPWVSDQWLGDLFLYKSYELGGWPLVYGLCTAVYFGAFFLLIYPIVRRESGSAVIAACAVLLGFKIGQVHFIVRPVIFGFPLFAAVYHILMEARLKLSRGEQPYFKYLLLIPIFFLWANLHPSFVLGGVLLGIFLVSLSWERVFYNNFSSFKYSPTLIALIFFALASLATFLNPYGADLHRSITALSGNEYFMRLHLEWHGLDFKKAEGKLFEGVVLIILLGLAIGDLKGKLKPFDFFCLVAFAHICLVAVRGLPYFGMVCCVPTAIAICSLINSRVLKEFSWGKKIVDGSIAIKERENRTIWQPVAWLGVIIPLISSVWMGRVWPFAGEYGPNDERYAFKAIELMKAAVSEPTVVINHSNFGGFLTWYGAPLLKPVHDDRNTLLGEEFYKQMEKVLAIGDDLKTYATRTHAKFLMINSESGQAKHLKATGEFPVFYEDKAVSVFDLRGLQK
jgi:hypothetical protein